MIKLLKLLALTVVTTGPVAGAAGCNSNSKSPVKSKPVGPALSPTKPDDLANYDITNNTVAPPAAPKINYNKTSYSPWYDEGFNWQQFLSGAGNIGNTVINKALDSSNNVIRLGFITSYDTKAMAKAKPSPVLQSFKTWYGSKPDSLTLPSIGGILPLWMANWTDAWGAATPATHQAGSAVYQFLTKIREAGKDYEFSFGGWNHDSLAMTAYLKKYTPQQLANLYAGIINGLKLKIVDFDVEGTDSGSTDDFGNHHPLKEGEDAQSLRLAALKILKKYDKNLKIEFTYPVHISGISDPFIQKQIKTEINDKLVWRYNIMPFDFTLWGYNQRITLPGENAIYAMSAVNSMASLLKSDGVQDPYQMLQATMMDGVNDQKYEVTTLTDYQLFVNFAITHKMAGVTFWSLINDMEQQIYSDTALRTGHTFGLWAFNDMLTGNKGKDAYSGGLKAADLSFSTLAKQLAKGKNGITNYNGKIDIDSALWQGIKDKGIISNLNPSAITNQNIIALYSNNFSFSTTDKTGFGGSLTTAAASKTALQNELNWAEWSSQYLDKNLQ